LFQVIIYLDNIQDCEVGAKLPDGWRQCQQVGLSDWNNVHVLYPVSLPWEHTWCL